MKIDHDDTIWFYFLPPMNKKSILKGSMRKIIEELHAGTT